MMMTRRLIQLLLGLSLYGVSMALMVRAGLGLDPWDVFHQGLAGRVGLSIGLVVNIVGAGVLLLWIPLRQWPGIGTIANVLVIGTAMDLSLLVLPDLDGLPVRGAGLALAVVANGVAGALYIGAGLGPGPRDGLMTGLARSTGWPPVGCWAGRSASAPCSTPSLSVRWCRPSCRCSRSATRARRPPDR